MNITLKKWNFHDKDSLVKMCNTIDRTYLSNSLPYPYTHKDADFWLNKVEEHEGKNGIYRAIVMDERVIGNISVIQASDVFYKDAEIGYMLLPEYASQGIMSEAVKQICEIAFSQLDILRITGLVFGPHIASRKVLEKNGFVLEGIKKKAVIKEKHIYDLNIYGLLNKNNKDE